MELILREELINIFNGYAQVKAWEHKESKPTVDWREAEFSLAEIVGIIKEPVTIAHTTFSEEELEKYLEEHYKKGYIDGGVDALTATELTEEKAIEYLQNSGWLPEHDRILTSRPKGKWIKETNPNHSPFDNSSEYIYHCSNCGRAEYQEGFYCRLCGAKMEVGL